MQLRYGELSGILRFDIAPGSILKIDTPTAENRLTGIGKNFVVATVTSVSFVIDSERGIAGTSFGLGHIRQPNEETKEKFTTAGPPMYSKNPAAPTAWYGGPLAVPKTT